MMRRVRHVAVMLLLLVFPFQALAAVMMIVSPGHNKHVSTPSALTLAHGKAPMTVRTADHQHNVPGLVPHHHDRNGSADASCSGCGECCCPVSLTAADCVFPAAFAAGEACVPFVAPSVQDLLPHRLERPPRGLLV